MRKFLLHFTGYVTQSNSQPGVQKITSLLWKLQVQQPFQNRLPLDKVSRQMKPAYICALYLLSHDPVQCYSSTQACVCWSQLPRGLRRRCEGARFLGLGVRIPLGIWMCVSCGCCVLSGLAYHSSRGVLPNVVCLSVIVKLRQWGGPDPIEPVAPCAWEKLRLIS